MKVRRSRQVVVQEMLMWEGGVRERERDSSLGVTPGILAGCAVA